MTKYLLDTNVFIEAKNRYYGFEFCPAFWSFLILANKRKEVFSIDKVKEEICKGNDYLKKWVKDKGKGLFLDIDKKVAKKFNEVAEYIKNKEYTEEAAKI